MIISYELKSDTKLTEEQERMLEEVDRRPIVFDEDCPEFTEEQLKKFSRVSDKKIDESQKQTVTLSISRQAFDTAKSFGTGYTAILSRILENALKDQSVIQRFL